MLIMGDNVKKIKLLISTLFLMFAFSNVKALEIVAKNETTNTPYVSIDKALDEAKEKDVIVLYKDVTPTKTFYKSLTFKGGHKITYNVYGWRYDGTLTLDNASLVVNSLNNSKQANNGEAARWVTMVLSGSLKSMNNSHVTFTFDSNYGVTNAIYAGGKGVKIDIANNSTFSIYGRNTKGKSGQGIQLDSTANTGIFVTGNSKFLIDGTNRGYVNSPTVYVENSNFTVQNCTSNASNGGEFIAINSKMSFLNNLGHGLSTGSLKLSNKATVEAINNLYYGVTSTNCITVDNTSSITATKNGSGYIGGGIRLGLLKNVLKSNGTIQGKIILKNNYRHALENYGNFKFDPNAVFNALENNDSSNGAGIYNGGNLTLPLNTSILKNKSGNLGGGIYNFGTIKFLGEAAVYNNHATSGADDLYNEEGKHLIFPKVAQNAYLDDCNDLIDDWYIDDTTNRWNAHDEEKKYIQKYTETYDTTNKLLLKAAHSLKGKVIVRYIDEEGNSLSKSDEMTGYVDSTYQTKRKDIPKYSLKSVDGNESGVYSKENILVTYIYTKKKSKLIVRYVDEENNNLKDEESYIEMVDTPYETKSLEFSGYALSKEPENKVGTYQEKDTIVTYVYKKLKGVLEILFLDESGNPLHDKLTSTDFVNNPYKTTKLDIPKYTLLRVEGNESGYITKDKTIVTYVYTNKKGKLIVRYVDEDGNYLKDEESYVEVIDTPYETSTLEFSGHIISKEPDNKKGIYTEEDIVVTYVYTKIKTTMQELEIPKTGSKIKNYLYPSIITVMSAIYIFLRKRG